MSMITRFIVCGICSAAILQGCKTDRNSKVARARPTKHSKISNTKSENSEFGSEISNTKRLEKTQSREAEKSYYASLKNDFDALKSSVNTHFTEKSTSVTNIQQEVDALKKQLEEATTVHENRIQCKI
jgi:ATP-dependent Lon protease